MLVAERFPAQGLFVGERTLRLRNVPKAAVIKSARLRLVPMTAAGDQGVSVDPVAFEEVTTADPQIVTAVTGETKTRVADADPPWVELDFHGRRTLVDVTGSDLEGTTLQVDFGGTFVEINQNGAVLAAGVPEPSGEPFTLSASPAALPGLVVPRLRITAPSDGAAPDVTQVRLRNAASNLTAAFSGQPPFWAQPGEIAIETISTDFTLALQAFLDQAEAPDGEVEIPIVLRSDTPGRLDVIVELDFDTQVEPLGAGLAEATLPFAFNGSPEADADLLTLKVPLGSRLNPAATSARVVGRFDNSKIILGHLERLNGSGTELDLEEGLAAAQRFEVTEDLSIDSLDILVATNARHARLQVDLRADLDGKPDSASLLSDAVEVTIGDADTASSRWVNAVLPAALKAAAADPLTGASRRLWLIVQSVEGASRWRLASRAESDASALQSSDNGGLAWRAAGLPESAGPPHEAEFRLRQDTTEFNIPLEIEVGAEKAVKRIDLNQFRPLGRIDFALDSVELANAVNEVLDESEREACPRGEQLINPTFELDDSPDPDVYSPAFWTVSGEQPIFQASTNRPSFIQLGNIEGPSEPSAVSQMVPASPGCTYELVVVGTSSKADGRVELVWRSSSCEVTRADTLTLPVPTVSFIGAVAPSTIAFFPVSAAAIPPLPTTSLRVTAPDTANQMEVRLLAPADTVVRVMELTLQATPQSLINGNFRQFDPVVGFPGWTVDPDPETSGFMPVVDVVEGRIALRNETGLLQSIIVFQKVDVAPAAAYSFAFTGQGVPTGDGADDPAVEILWLDQDGNSLGMPVQRTLGEGASDLQSASGTVPEGAARAEIRLVLPDQSQITIDNIEFVQRPLTEVPVVLLSAAPGEVTLRDVAVSFEPVPPPPLALPETGFCQPTPADRLPGEVCEIDEKTCRKDDGPSAARGSITASPVTGRPPSAVTLPGRPLPPAGTGTFIPIRRRETGVVVRRLVLPPSELPSLSVLTGIGPRRQEILREVGIRTIRDIAAIGTEELRRRIEVSPDSARALINEAQAMLGRPRLRAEN